MLQITGKTFMNLQEAVQWLLDNNALPFQSSANYIANTEIGMGTIVNPSPAKVRIGSLIFFADSKVSTVTGITENGFIVSDQYNNLVDDIAYVTNVAINASGHLITTLSDGQTIDAGIIKQVLGFSIDASQHLIVSFNDGTSTDLGAIFSGNVNISGTLQANEIIEIMNPLDYGFVKEADDSDLTKEFIYAGVSKTGNKITFALFMNLTKLQTITSYMESKYVGKFKIKDTVGANLYPLATGTGFGNILCNNVIEATVNNANTSVPIHVIIQKESDTSLRFYFTALDGLTVNEKTTVRFDITFLLSSNLAS